MQNEQLQKFSNNLVLELNELKKLGVKVSNNVLSKAKDLEVIAEYEDMGVTDCADLLLALY